ncbi:PqqA binding protein [Mycovorax composti]|jgi:Coenzyme PQQ synthesis protein D (PqqD).|uniref:PqqA binding protein n=2 Tax=Chitinophagaceae TaxID=563835 RepID=A0ABZ2EJ53_9BACT
MSYQFNAKDVLVTQLGEEGVAFNSATNEYFSLNETSYKILKGIENNTPVEDIIQQLEAEYDISTEECSQAVHNIIRTFIEKKLVVEA